MHEFPSALSWDVASYLSSHCRNDLTGCVSRSSISVICKTMELNSIEAGNCPASAILQERTSSVVLFAACTPDDLR